jgi:hypothetical protein
MSNILKLRFDPRRAPTDEMATLRSVINTAVQVFHLRGTLSKEEIAAVLFDISTELRGSQI